MNTKNETNLIVIGKYERLKKKKKKKKEEEEEKKKKLPETVCLPGRLIVHIFTT